MGVSGLDTILRAPGLSEYLLSGVWKEDFERVTLNRCRSLTGPARMASLRVGAEDDIVFAEAIVIGSRRRYRPRVEFYQEPDGAAWEFVFDCDCPAEYECEHVAAVLERLHMEVDKAGPLVNPEPEALAVALRQVPGLADWLRRVDTACELPSQPTQAGQEKFLAYCIRAREPGEDPVLVLRYGERQASGKVRMDEARREILQLADPAHCFQDDDRLILLLASGLPQVMGASAVELRLIGPHSREVLERALVTGRLFFITSRMDREGVLLSAGEPRKLQLEWRRDGDGVRPGLSGGEGMILIPSQPPMVVDPERCLLCPADLGGLPARLIDVWPEGPAVPERFVHGLAGRIERSRAPVELPAPKQLETRIYRELDPVPVLTVKHVRIDLAFRPRFEILIGEVMFRYGDSPPLSPLDPGESPASEAIVGVVRHVITRSKEKEAALQKRLKDFDLVQIQTLLSGMGGLPPRIRYAVVPENPFPTRECAWIEFLHGKGAETLRGEGWVIEAEESALLVVHDVQEFTPQLEHDSSIDWFRFDAAFEIEGRRISLIPLIADYLARFDGIPEEGDPEAAEWIVIPVEDFKGGVARFPARRFFGLVENVRHLLTGSSEGNGALRVHRLQAAGLAAEFQLDASPTLLALKKLGETLREFKGLPAPKPPSQLKGSLRAYQLDGFHWMQFLARNDLHGILADDMGLGKTVQALTHLLAEKAGGHSERKPSLVLAPTSVVPNWESEAKRFAPSLKTLVLHGPDRAANFKRIGKSDLVVTSYALLSRDFEELSDHEYHAVILDEAQHVKNPQAKTAQLVCDLRASHRMCLSGTPLQNHLGELWSLMRFLMPGYLGDADGFRRFFRTPIEKAGDSAAQVSLNRRVAPLLLRRTKDEVAGELPAKTEIVHRIALTEKQVDLYESVRAAMDKRVRDAIAAKGLERSHIIVLDALLKLRQICCHPKLLKTPAAQKVGESAKLMFLTDDLLPTLIEEGRRILLFSQFTTMLALIEAWFESEKVPFVKLTGQTRDRKTVVATFQEGKVPVFLISLKAGGTGLNLTAADTVIHYDPWWNPAVEAQATDRAHRIGQDKPVFVHKLICRGTIEERIQELQAKKSALVEALLSENTNKLRIDRETLSDLLAPMR